jgi:DNA modification methylase
MKWLNQTHLGDCRLLMRQMIKDGVKVDCVVTSPPYWGLRDYGVAGAFGLERTHIRHIARMRHVFRLVRELLTEDGVLWLNYGDSYANDGKWGGETGGKQAYLNDANRKRVGRTKRRTGLKPKDMVGMPWRIAFALQEDGWYLRSDCIWHKPNPMPESVKDRPTKSHEYVFLLAKSELYHYDAQAIKEPVTMESHRRGKGTNPKARSNVAGWQDGPGSHTALEHGKRKDAASGPKFAGNGVGFGHGYDSVRKTRTQQSRQNESFSAAVTELVDERNARTVWTVPTQPFEGAHFATFPEELVARCILSGSRADGIIFDPFMGAGTVAKVATDLGRHYIGLELNPDYVALARHRRTTQGMQI